MTGSRLGRRILEQLGVELSERDEELLQHLAQLRFMTSAQIRNLVFHDKRSPSAALRATNREMAKLRSHGIVTALDRRIGGVRAGSGSYVWTLTEGGARLVGTTGSGRKARLRQPSVTFLEHHLAVTEAVVRLHAATRRTNTTVEAVQAEPECWRRYIGPHGSAMYLKPDLAVTTSNHLFDDHWFLEIDLDTEPPSRVVRKCHQYDTYRRTGIEQQSIGVFPAVVWIVPSEARRVQLQRHLEDAALDLRVFIIITLDALPNLVAAGAEHFINNITGGQEGGHTS